jgi:hypothetical protein
MGVQCLLCLSKLTEPIVRLAIDIAKNIHFTDMRTSNSTYNHTNYEENQNYSIQIIKYNHSVDLKEAS